MHGFTTPTLLCHIGFARLHVAKGEGLPVLQPGTMLGAERALALFSHLPGDKPWRLQETEVRNACITVHEGREGIAEPHAHRRTTVMGSFSRYQCVAESMSTCPRCTQWASTSSTSYWSPS
jgi:hypothetical protein